jgi:hypothetical protein
MNGTWPSFTAVVMLIQVFGKPLFFLIRFPAP